MAQDNPFPNLGGLSYSEDVFFRILDDLLGVGVVGATDYQVIQNHLGANMSVDVNPGSGYVAIANGGKRRTRLPAQSNSGTPGSPNSADNWTTTFVSADATNPRIDRVALTVQDTSVDGSGASRSILRVVAGTPTAGATLANLNGAAAVPANSILLANVLVPNLATTVVTANIADTRAHAALAGAIGQPRAKVHKSAAQAIANATVTVLAFDVEDVDTEGIHDNVTNNSRLTCVTPGLYLIVLQVVWDGASAVGDRTAYITKNGAGNNPPGVKSDRRMAVTGSGPTQMLITEIMPMAVGDYAEGRVYQNSGGGLNVQANEASFGTYTTLEMVRIGA